MRNVQRNIDSDSIMFIALYLLLWEGIQERKDRAHWEVVWSGPTPPD